MAGLFMMPLFFVYHHQCPVGSDEDKKWIEREDRLRRIILNPSIVIVWILGLMLAFNGGYWSEGWFHAKLLLVLGLSGYHGWLIGYFKKLKRSEEHTSELQSLMRISYAVFCLKKKTQNNNKLTHNK